MKSLLSLFERTVSKLVFFHEIEDDSTMGLLSLHLVHPTLFGELKLCSHESRFEVQSVI